MRGARSSAAVVVAAMTSRGPTPLARVRFDARGEEFGDERRVAVLGRASEPFHLFLGIVLTMHRVIMPRVVARCAGGERLSEHPLRDGPGGPNCPVGRLGQPGRTRRPGCRVVR